MNSMAWRPDRGLLDLHGGLKDLLRGRLRCVGDPLARFDEDALRLMRAIRFAVSYNLQPEPDLTRAATRLSDRLDRLSRERLAAETLRILAAPFPERLEAFSGCGLMAAAARILLDLEIDDSALCRRLQSFIRTDLPHEERLPLLFIAAAVSSFDPRSLGAALDPYFKGSSGHLIQHLLMARSRLSLHDARAGEAMLYLARLRMLFPVERLPGEIVQRRMFRLLARRCHLAAEDIAPVAVHAMRLMTICLAQTTGFQESALLSLRLADMAPLVLGQLAISGRQLLDMGFRPGPPMRILLERLLSRAVSEPACNRPDDLKEHAASLMAASNA
jgi:tRNA nucleotidyltransferase (CCA-adding enzyme)